MKHSRRGPSPALQEFGRRLEASYGIEPLRPGERRPDDYYLVNHYIGRNTCPPGTVEVDGKIVPPRLSQKRLGSLCPYDYRVVI
jgi:hypothetical protein